MRSAVEPWSREEDTTAVRCRDTGSEGGGFGARLSDRLNMYPTEPVDNMDAGMPAMRFLQGGERKMAPLEGRAKP